MSLSRLLAATLSVLVLSNCGAGLEATDLTSNTDSRTDAFMAQKEIPCSSVPSNASCYSPFAGRSYCSTATYNYGNCTGNPCQPVSMTSSSYTIYSSTYCTGSTSTYVF